MDYRSPYEKLGTHGTKDKLVHLLKLSLLNGRRTLQQDCQCSLVKVVAARDSWNLLCVSGSMWLIIMSLSFYRKSTSLLCWLLVKYSRGLNTSVMFYCVICPVICGTYPVVTFLAKIFLLNDTKYLSINCKLLWKRKTSIDLWRTAQLFKSNCATLVNGHFGVKTSRNSLLYWSVVMTNITCLP